MREVDKPFRFTWDFCVVWTLLLVATIYLLPRWGGQSAVEHYGLVFFIALFATFLLYGPVLLVQQVLASGSRGWFVARVFLSVIIVAAIFLGAMYWLGFYTEWRARIFAFFLVACATAYLQSRLDRQS
jgi:hypothetical protein